MKFSIITVCKNAENSIERNIKSVLSQTYNNIEHIIIDGNSTDGTLDKIRHYEKEIAVFISEDDSGIYNAMNKGILRLSGDIIYFLNSDDYFYDENVLDDISRFFLQNPDVDLVYGDVIKKYFDPEYSILYSEKLSLRQLKKGIQPPHQGTFIRRDKLLSIGLFNEKYLSSSDFDFFCRVLTGKLNYKKIDKIISYFMFGGMSSIKHISWIETANIIKEYFGFYHYLISIIKTKVKLFIRLVLIKLDLFKYYKYLLKRIYKG